MRSLRKTLAVFAASVALAGAGFVSSDLLRSPQSAQAQDHASATQPAPRAPQQVQTTPQQMAMVQDLAAAFRNVGQVVEPSVVSIRVTKTIRGVHRGNIPDDLLRRFFPDNDGDGEPDVPQGMPNMPNQGDNGNDDTLREVGTGSGVVMEATDGVGYIITNNHVASDATEMEVTLNDGRIIRNAQVMGTDPNTDLAVVKIETSGLTPAKWGDSGQLQPGDWVMAFGSPFGYVGSMTHGIVSALHRQAGILGQYGYENFIQVDAPINPGNSGGPLVNLHGEVVGINAAIASRNGGFQGIGFAIPANQAKQIYQILKTEHKVVRGWLGVRIADVSKYADAAKHAGYQGNTGTLVVGVLRNSPAYGILQGNDVIVGINGQSVKDQDEFRNAVAMMAPGTQVTLQVVRAGKQQDVSVKLGEQPSQGSSLARAGGQANPETSNAMGMRLSDVSDQLIQRYNLPEKTSGALVTAVQRGSAAEQAGVERGDVIVKVDNQAVSNASQAGDVLSKADLSKGVSLNIVNNEGTKMVFIKK